MEPRDTFFPTCIYIYILKFTQSLETTSYDHKGNLTRQYLPPHFRTSHFLLLFLLHLPLSITRYGPKNSKLLPLPYTIILPPFLSSRNFDNFSFTLFFNPCPPIVKIYSHFHSLPELKQCQLPPSLLFSFLLPFHPSFMSIPKKRKIYIFHEITQTNMETAIVRSYL